MKYRASKAAAIFTWQQAPQRSDEGHKTAALEAVDFRHSFVRSGGDKRRCMRVQ